MAVLRAQRLWESPAAISAQDSPGVFAPVLLWTVPTGYRAIVRCMTAVLVQPIPPDTGFWYEVFFKPVGLPQQGAHKVWWTAGFDPNAYGPTLATDIWRGMLVLHSGEQLLVNNTGPQAISHQGSGMLLEERT